MSQREREMESGPEEAVMAQAMAWQVALAADDADWDGFTDWLEADPAHARAYDAVALIDDMVEQHRDALHAGPSEDDGLPALPPAANDRGVPLWRRPFAWASGAGVALAAAVVALLIIGVPGGQGGADIVATPAGQTRTVVLADSSTVTLAPASRLQFAKGDRTQVSLSGSAVFDIRHRPDRQLTIRAGRFLVTDIGTRFSIDSDSASLRIAVEQGEVAVQVPGAAEPLALTAGRRLLYLARSNSLEITALASGSFASWRQGSLVYHDAPLAVVAADISRYAGQRIALDPAIADQRFCGVLGIGDGSNLAGDLARLMDLSVETHDGTIRLAPGDRR